MPADHLHIRDKLVADFTGAEKMNGRLPDPGKAEKVAADLLSGTFDAPKRKDPVPGKPKPDVKEQLAARGATLLNEAEVKAIRRRSESRRPSTKSERVEAALAQRRMWMLSQFPEWKARMLAAGELGYQKWVRALRGDGEETSLTVLTAREYMRVLDESNATFGDWTRLPAGRRITTVGRPAKGA